MENLAQGTPLLEGLCYPGANKGTLDDLILESIDETLKDLLGGRIREAIYDHLVRNASLSREKIVRHLNVFFELLERTFGKGSEVIGKVIIKKLYSKLEWEFAEIIGFKFEDYMQAIRVRIARECIGLAKSSSSR